MKGPINRIIKGYWESDLPDMMERDFGTLLEDDLINDIVGPRRAGKTYLMFLMIKDLIRERSKESTIYINFENRQLLPLKGDHFNAIIEFIHAEGLLDRFGRIHLFLDEVQRLDGWERYVRSIYDEFKGKIKIVVSGSCASLLSKEYSRSLTGRHLTRSVLSLNFREFLLFNNIEVGEGVLSERREAKVKSLLREYLRYGGFPEVTLRKNKDEMISQLFYDIVNRDVLSRAKVRNKEVMEEFANFLASNVSNLLSFNKMSRYFRSRGIDVSVPTLITYFEHMKDAFLFFDNPIFSYKIKDQKQYPRKIYSIDNGIAHLLTTGEDGNLGNLCENLVAVHLLGMKKSMYYWKGKGRNGKEVDIVVKEGRKLKPIQVCYDIESMDTREREVRALIECMDELKAKEGTVVTMDHEEVEKIRGKRIIFSPLWKFLLRAF